MSWGHGVYIYWLIIRKSHFWQNHRYKTKTFSKNYTTYFSQNREELSQNVDTINFLPNRYIFGKYNKTGRRLPCPTFPFLSCSIYRTTLLYLSAVVFTFRFLGDWLPRNKLSNNCRVGVVFAKPATTREQDSVPFFVSHGNLFNKHGPTTPISIVADAKFGDL